MVGRLLIAALLSLTLGPAPAGARPKVHTVVIDNMAFGPAPVGIHVGDTVVWVNKDIFRHTATARDKSFDLDIVAGGSARTTVTRTGTLDYFCRYHPGMVGQIAVSR